MIEPNGYVLVKIRSRISSEEADALYTDKTHPLALIIRNENDIFHDIVDALLAKDKKESPDDYIVLPYW